LKVTHRRQAAGQAFLDFRFAGQPIAPRRPDACNDAGGGSGDGGPLWVPLEPLEGDAEFWLADQPVAQGPLGSFEARHCGDLLALSCWRRTSSRQVEAEVRRLYLEALAAVNRVGFPHLIRVWNYLPAINAGCGEAENYKQFCAGRAAALRELQLDPAGLPAASALGCEEGLPLQLTFLASRVPGKHLDNPRQVSAHQYPRRYGENAPSFARATLLGRRLLISGTASIVGHESQYPGNLERQLRCTADNLLVLMDHACAEGDARRVENLQARVYLRHAEHLPQARHALTADLPNLASAVFLRADVCRHELLVEVEATGVLR
jgi:chorismate lyase / 3-hydroxybenzoate synthase